jgi:hypothetical protein
MLLVDSFDLIRTICDRNEENQVFQNRKHRSCRAKRRRLRPSSVVDEEQAYHKR